MRADARRDVMRALALVALVWGIASTTRADWRVLEANAPPPPGERTEPDEDDDVPTPGRERDAFEDDHRWLDVIALVQAGIHGRFTRAEDGIDAGEAPSVFWVQRARIGARAQIFSWLQLRADLGLEAPGPAAQSVYVDGIVAPWLTLRLGQQRSPFLRTYGIGAAGLGFLDRPLYAPLANLRAYLPGVRGREIGIHAFGRIGDPSPDSRRPVLEYHAGLFLGTGANRIPSEVPALLYVARLELHILGVPDGVDTESDLARNVHPRVAVALAGTSGCGDDHLWTRGFTFDAELRWQGLYASASFVWLRSGASGQALRDESGARTGGHTGAFFLADTPGCQGIPDESSGEVRADYVSRGAHLQLQYVLPRFLDAFGAPWNAFDLELLARIDYVDPLSPHVETDPLFGGGPGTPGYTVPSSYAARGDSPTRWRLTFGLFFYPTGRSSIRLGVSYEHRREAEDVIAGTGRYAGVADDVLWAQAHVGL